MIVIRVLGTSVLSLILLAASPIPDTVGHASRCDLSLPTEFTKRGVDPAQDPLGFLHASLQKSESIRGYHVTLTKQERIGNELGPVEVIDVRAREAGFAIVMLWLQGERKAFGSAIQGTLFVSGENNGRMKVWRPNALIKIVDVSPTDTSARASSRYAIQESGLSHSMKRTIQSCELARRRHELQVAYLGLQEQPELNGRRCHVFRRVYVRPEVEPFLLADPAKWVDRWHDQAVASMTIWIDDETGLQLGAELLRSDGSLLGRYFFRIHSLNPIFEADTFTTASFKLLSKR